MPGQRLLVLVLVAALSSLQGCWLQVGFDAGHTRYNDLEDELTADNVDSLEAAWSADLLPTAAEPMVRGDRVYVTTGGFDPESGSSAVSARAFASATGAPAWSRTFVSFCCAAPSLDYTTPTFVGDELWTGYLLVYFGGGTPVGDFSAPVRVSPADGSILGRETTAVASPAVDSEVGVVQVVYDPLLDIRTLVQRSSTSSGVLWSTLVPGTVDVSVAPVVVGGGLAVVADGQSLSAYAIGCVSPSGICDPAWHRDLGGTPASIVARAGTGEVLTTTGDELVAVDATTGETLWTAPLGATAPGLAVTADTIYVGAAATLRAFAADGCGAAMCEPTWTAPLGTSATSSPVVAGGAVYVGGTGTVEVFPADGCGAATCPLLTDVAVAGPVDHVVVADGRLFAVSRPTAGAARLTAFTPSGPA